MEAIDCDSCKRIIQLEQTIRGLKEWLEAKEETSKAKDHSIELLKSIINHYEDGTYLRVVVGNM